MTGGLEGHTPTPTPRSINPPESDLSTQTAHPLLRRPFGAATTTENAASATGQNHPPIRSIPPLALPNPEAALTQPQITQPNPYAPLPVPAFAMQPQMYDPSQMMLPPAYASNQGQPEMQMQMQMQMPPMYVPYSPWASTNAVAPAMNGAMSPMYGGQDAYGNHIYVINAPQGPQTPRERKSALDEPLWPGLIYLFGCLFGPCFWISGVYWWNAKDSRSRFLGRLNVVSFVVVLIVIVIAMSIR